MGLNDVNPLTADILPDSRATVISTPKHATFELGMFWVPIYCGSCGREGGRVPEENMTFAFWLCQECEPKYGHLTAHMMVPDAVFWERVKQEQLNHGAQRLLTTDELQAVLATDTTPLATLLKQGR